MQIIPVTASAKTRRSEQACQWAGDWMRTRIFVEPPSHHTINNTNMEQTPERCSSYDIGEDYVLELHDTSNQTKQQPEDSTRAVELSLGLVEFTGRLVVRRKNELGGIKRPLAHEPSPDDSLEALDIEDGLHERKESGRGLVSMAGSAALARWDYLTSIVRRRPTADEKQQTMKHVTSICGLRRLESKESSCQTDENPPPTRLHELCGAKDCTLLQLRDALSENPEAASIPDSLGRLPLHILGNNEELLEESRGRDIATEMALDLMRVYPKAITTLDGSGRMPFIPLLEDWVRWLYEDAKSQRTPNAKTSFGSNLVNRVVGFATSARESDDKTVPSSSPEQLIRRSTRVLCGHIELWAEVEWCLCLLSIALDELCGKNGGLYRPETKTLDQNHGLENKECSDLALHLVTIVPTILMIVLLLEEEGGDVRRRLLNLSVIRRVLLCPQSVGSWLTTMLRHSGVPSKRAVDYLSLVSETSIIDYMGSYRSNLAEDQEQFQLAKKSVFDAVQDLDGVIPSLVTLEEREIERASITEIVWYVMSENLARPFVVGLVLIDLVLHLTLLIA